jgi:molybdate transport system permease protein
MAAATPDLLWNLPSLVFQTPDSALNNSSTLLMESAWIALGLSLKVAGWATAINMVLGIAAGYALARCRFPGRNFLDAMLTLPMVMPPTVLGYYLLVVIGRKGWIGAWLHDSFGINLIFTWQGAVIAAAVVAFPLVFKSARAAFEAVDDQLEQAAEVLGASAIGIFFRVTLPLAWRGILAGLLLAFARGMGEFGATLMVAGSIPGKTQTLSVAVYEAVQAGQDDTANLLVLITSITCIAVLLVAGKLAPGHAGRNRE